MKGLDEFSACVREEVKVGNIASRIGKLVAMISGSIAVLVTFTDITFGGIGAKEMTTVLAVLMASAYLIYFSLEEAGERRGEESEEYISASSRHEKLCAILTPDMIPRLRDFLTDYTVSEAESGRRAALLRAGYTEEEFSAYLKGKPLKRSARRVMRRVERIKPAQISLADIISRGRPKNRSELYNPERRERVKMILQLMPTTLCMIVTASIMMSIKHDLGPEEILEGMIKLSTLPVVGARGYLAGLCYAKDIRSSWLLTKSRILECFLAKEGLTIDC